MSQMRRKVENNYSTLPCAIYTFLRDPPYLIRRVDHQLTANDIFLLDFYLHFQYILKHSKPRSFYFCIYPTIFCNIWWKVREDSFWGIVDPWYNDKMCFLICHLRRYMLPMTSYFIDLPLAEIHVTNVKWAESSAKAWSKGTSFSDIQNVLPG